jgi:phage baseplate assembly protein W
MSMRKFKGFSTVNKKWGNFKLYDIDLAKQDLLNELYTRKGERIMSPEFGSIIWDLLFDPISDETTKLIEEDMQRILTKDPRLELKQLDVQEDIDSQIITVAIILNYVPTATLTELIATFNRDTALSRTQG